jgi:hypothetical protein
LCWKGATPKKKEKGEESSVKLLPAHPSLSSGWAVSHMNAVLLNLEGTGTRFGYRLTANGRFHARAMVGIMGYGEDALTLWALKHQTAEILREFEDKTAPSDCLIFYLPSFGGNGGTKSAEFGEFDAILTSKKNSA